MNKVSRSFFVFFLCVLTQTLLLAQTNIDLFILAGQSNAQGYKGDAAQYPTNAIDTAIRLTFTDHGSNSSGGLWTKMQPQAGLFNAGHFGPEVTFSRALKAAGYNPAIFKYVAPGTGLAVDWKAPGAGGIYDAMVVAYKAAIKKLTDAGNTVTVRGFVWIQGESDGYDNATYANAYEANLKKLINDIRLNVVANSCLPFVLGVDEQFPGTYINTIVQTDKKLDSLDTQIIFTSMIGLQKADVTHLTPTGLIAHGTRIYDGYVALVPNAAAFTNCTPTIAANKAAGTYYTPFSVVLTGSPGSTIRYTTDGTTPTATTGTVYSAAIAVNATTTIKAISVAGGNTSTVLTLAYTIAPLTVSADKAAGTYYAPISVVLTGTSGSTIRYTTDGSTPTATTGTVYSAAIAVSATTTITAISVIGSTTSTVLTLAYTITPLTVSADKASGSYTAAFNVTLTGTSGSTIRYTTDGTTPTATTGTVYSAPIAISASKTIKAISVIGSATSAVLTLTYTIAPLTVSANKASGPYTAPLSVTLTSSVGATIRYTTDGTTPTATTGTVYSAAITINATTTLKAIAVSGTTTSAVLTLSYSICATTTNLALNKTATQSSTAYSAAASRAVDGNTSGVWGNNSVTHTNADANAWWQVDLGAVNNIDVIKLFNRTDCCGERLANVYVIVSQVAFTSTTLSTTLAQSGVKSFLVSGTPGVQTDIPFNVKGRYVRVQLQTTTGTNLSLAEVQVVGCAVSTAAPLISNTILTIDGRQEGTKAVVSWVSNEDDADYFVVERLNSDNNAFEKLETVNAQVQNAPKELKYYSTTDNAPAKGVNIYRVGVILQGKSTPQYSGQIALDFSQFVNYAVSPNPALDYVDININEKQIEDVKVHVMDLMGKTVMQQQMSKATGTIHLSVEGLEAGQYLIFVEAKGKRATAKKLTIVK